MIDHVESSINSCASLSSQRCCLNGSLMLQVLLAFVFCYQALNTHIEAERGERTRLGHQSIAQSPTNERVIFCKQFTVRCWAFAAFSVSCLSLPTYVFRALLAAHVKESCIADPSAIPMKSCGRRTWPDGWYLYGLAKPYHEVQMI
jgi:hypothetical protein